MLTVTPVSRDTKINPFFDRSRNEPVPSARIRPRAAGCVSRNLPLKSQSGHCQHATDGVISVILST